MSRGVGPASLLRRLVLVLVSALIVSFGFVSSPGSAAGTDEYNLLKSGDYSEFALCPEASIDEEGDSPIMYHTSSDPRWVFSVAILPVDGQTMRRLQFAFSYKLDGVKQGTESWYTARFYVESYDEAGTQLDKWPTTPYWKGTSDWKVGKWTVDVPKTAAKVKLYVGLDRCVGTFGVKDLVIYALDANKNKVLPLE